MTTIQLVLPDDLADRLRAAAEERGVTLEALVAAAVEQLQDAAGKDFAALSAELVEEYDEVLRRLA